MSEEEGDASEHDEVELDDESAEDQEDADEGPVASRTRRGRKAPTPTPGSLREDSEGEDSGSAGSLGEMSRPSGAIPPTTDTVGEIMAAHERMAAALASTREGPEQPDMDSREGTARPPPAVLGTVGAGPHPPVYPW